MTRGDVRLEVGDDGVAVVSLVGANRLNVFDLAMRDGLLEALTAVRDHPDARALLLRADGPNFSAGADLREFGSAGDVFESRWIRARRDPWRILWTVDLPTVVALHGVAFGSGMEMALLCDVRVADRATRFALPEARLGMLPAACGTQSLTRAIGPAAALPLVALGTEIDAGEALRLGVVHRLSDDTETEALTIAQRLAQLDRAGALARELRGR